MDTLVSKLSSKTLCGKISAPPSGSAYLYRIVGIAEKTSTGETTFGSFTCFHGSFRGSTIDHDTGEVKTYRSGKCFLPDIATSLLSAAVDANGGGVEFAFDIGIKKADNPMGYEYTVVPIIETRADDPLEKLSASLPAMVAVAPKQNALNLESPQDSEAPPVHHKNKKA
jgi:hypothetical protein